MKNNLIANINRPYFKLNKITKSYIKSSIYKLIIILKRSIKSKVLNWRTKSLKNIRRI